MKRFLIAVGAILIAGTVYLVFNQNHTSPVEPAIESINIPDPADTVAEVTPEPKKLYGIVIDNMNVVEDKVRRNENLSEILINHNVNPAIIHALAMASKDVFDVRHLKANKKYTLICDPDSQDVQVKKMIYEPNPTEYVVFHLDDSVLVELKQKDVELVERSVSGVIDYSLFETMKTLSSNHQLTNDFVDIFAWQIDFQRLQKGDRFKMIYEEKLVDGESVGIGEIKGIYFNHFENDYFAFPYDQGDGMEYFDEEGESLRKALLKYPIKFTRISSRFTKSRFHPVQKRWKAHKGTDFAAPKGTPIRSVGDGIVLNATYHKYNGNYVKIRHNSTYTTQYLHMSKIAGGIKAGVKVKQGQTIGFVGSTGLARGNHLCYRFWKNGVQVDALKVDLPSSSPILEENKSGFESTRDRILKLLNEIEFQEVEQTLFARGK